MKRCRKCEGCDLATKKPTPYPTQRPTALPTAWPTAAKPTPAPTRDSTTYSLDTWEKVYSDGAFGSFNAFIEAGNVFAPEVAGKLKRYIYSAGDTRDPAEAYTLFRGRLPTPDALLEKRGLAA